MPQWLAMRATFRVRKVMPPPQETEQGDQTAHWPQRPSRQPLKLQGFVLQASTCSLSPETQGAPPFCGARAMRRLRWRWPPSQVQVQELQTLQSPHWQSVRWQGRLNLHSRDSPKMSLQPLPTLFRWRRIWRLRTCEPTPHSAEHCPHSPHSPTRQSCTLQTSVLQPLTSMSSAGQSLPPFSGKCCTWRCRCVCPLQSLSQVSQSVHWETLQSTFMWVQVSVSRSAPRQASPPWSESCRMPRLRYLWPSTSHAAHSCQASSSQFCFVVGQC
mmetsp:Transcript_88806/g.287572  ORF Transcript_88806/g.287572 Transcript_88806/m.287572 type:complete len:271 (-) Transcript_88806:2108-2920(-)